ncbi:C3 and PZP-like alpha-2-macroglobulin domain-containing protein 8 [Echinococcus granulosus]|uniref:C3 and PZP-like alpha-2-macroglobulin domain-containing protein 8 n=1 Tax=Echinococcus granulosus TaxID=6210 RepID=W6UR62_ECHGR|nr:C3 and PZP-like alpha-2-macroglobulin domain-containing protein 8 [Echinococcus granulosus]EUB63161.1 C3 and PZP-like alpha-2-macroglobulin domain-containing protein 8 [Echinococcus granulosus]
MRGLAWQLLALFCTLATGLILSPTGSDEYADANNTVIISLSQEMFVDLPNRIILHSEKPIFKVIPSLGLTTFDWPIGGHSVADNRYTYDLKYCIPIELEPGRYFKLKITYLYCSSKSSSQLMEKRFDKTVRMVQRFIVIMGETDKPHYRPERDRRLQAPQFDSIVVRDPLNNIVRQWKNVQPLDALGLEHKVMTDAEEGEWQIEVRVRDYTEVIYFIVEHCSLPRFLAHVELPTTIPLMKSDVAFNVCATYTNGPFLRDTFAAQICICDESALERQQKEKKVFAMNKCASNYYSGNRTCMLINAILDGVSCVNIIANMSQLMQGEAVKWNERLGFFVNVVEEDTGFSVFTSGVAKVSVMNTSSVTCPGSVKLQVIANKALPHNTALTLQFLSRGQLTTRTMKLEADYACVPQDNEFGHYECSDGDRIRCLEGWKGDNCLTPVCGDNGCGMGGTCVAPCHCACKPGNLKLDGAFGPALRDVTYVYNDGQMASDFVKIGGLLACSSLAMAATEQGGGLQFDKQLVVPEEKVNLSVTASTENEDKVVIANTCLLGVIDASSMYFDSASYSIIDFDAYAGLLTSNQVYKRDDAIKAMLTNARLNKSLTVPDTLTAWEANAVCFTTDRGLWMPVKKPQLTVRMPFFVEFAPPLMARRGELLHLPISVFVYPETATTPTTTNTSKGLGGDGGGTVTPRTCYEVEVSVETDLQDWRVVGIASFTTCICAGDLKETFHLPLRPLRVGHLNVTAKAVAKRGSLICGDDDDDFGGRGQASKVVAIGDAVRRSVRVIAEGVEKQVTLGGIFCSSKALGDAKAKFTLRVSRIANIPLQMFELPSLGQYARNS